MFRPASQAPAAWEAGLGDVVTIQSAVTPGVHDLLGSTCVLVDVETAGVLDYARRVHRADSTVQTIVVAGADARDRAERGLLFTPGLGELWIVAPEDVGPALVERASGVTRQRRAHARRQRQVDHALATLEPSLPRRAMISDAYLAALLDAVPDPVLSVNAEGSVFSLNPAAERVFGWTRRAVLGRPLASALDLIRGTLPDLGVPGAVTGATTSDIAFRRPDGDLGEGELVVVPVEAGGLPMYMVILHDLTEERRTQHELEAVAGELEAQAAALQEQSNALEDALASRNRFYWSMSHELRTPINAIIGYNALLLDEIYGPLSEPQRQGIGRAQKAARHLTELIGDVLDLAKIEEGRIELETEVTRLPELLEDLMVTVEPLAAERGSTVTVVGEGTHAIRTDPRRLRQILLNLLSNAVKFGEGGPIRVGWWPEPDGGVSVEVADEGRGIAPDDLPALFEEFAQFGERQAGSTGLGLAISKRLAEALRGALTVRSELGRGSRFRLTLPADVPLPG